MKQPIAVKSFGTMPKFGKSVVPQLPFDKDKEYDLVVIGGGTGGITAASEARALGLSVALFDYVSPSPQGTTWGLGGTCVNVGCIPKKLMHIAAQIQNSYKAAEDFGWKPSESPEETKHDWASLRANVQGYIKSINFSYNKKMATEGIDYINAKASFADANTVEFQYAGMFQGNLANYQIKGKNFLIAAGGRPRGYPGIPDELCVTSDDLFSMEKDPGTTLVVGGGYIAIECAGFLAGLGKKVHILNRSSFLRTMDGDMAEKIVEQLQEEGVITHTKSTVKAVKLLEDGRKQVDLVVNGKDKQIIVDTIMVAIGRDCDPTGMQVEKAGVKFNPKSNKIIGRENEKERTNIDHIYAVGDIVEGVPELMPVAQKAGKLLAHRLKHRFDKTPEPQILDLYTTDYNHIPTTVFSPIEYSYVGLSEEEALSKYGEDEIEVYHRETTPLQYSIYKENTKIAYMKVITVKPDERVVGMHYYGPAADDVIGGFAVAMKLGLTKKHLDSTIGVHPSTSEDLFNLTATKRSGAEFRKTDC